MEVKANKKIPQLISEVKATDGPLMVQLVRLTFFKQGTVAWPADFVQHWPTVRPRGDASPGKWCDFGLEFWRSIYNVGVVMVFSSGGKSLEMGGKRHVKPPRNGLKHR